MSIISFINPKCVFMWVHWQCFNYKIGILKPQCQFSSEFIYFLAWKPLLIWRKGTFEEMSLSKQTSTPPLGKIYRFLLGCCYSVVDMRVHWGFYARWVTWPFVGLSFAEDSAIQQSPVYTVFSHCSLQTIWNTEMTHSLFSPFPVAILQEM